MTYTNWLWVIGLIAALGGSPRVVHGECPSPVLDDLEQTDMVFQRRGRKLAPFSPTPMVVVEAMLRLAQVTRHDLLYDLGSGDGRIVIAAAQKYGARAVGFEIDAERVQESRDRVRRAGVERLAKIRRQDFMTADLSAATVVTLYLVPEANMLLRPVLLSQLRPGARVVSHEFDMGDWEPDEVEDVMDSHGNCYTVLLWRIRE